MTAPLDRGLLPTLLGYQLRRAQIAVFQNFGRHLDELELTPGQFGVLTLIAANPGLSQTALGAALGIDRSTVVPLIDRLQGRGLVVRGASPGDRRSHALNLSGAGRTLLAEATRRVREHELAIAAGLTADERRLLLELLPRLAR